MRAGRAGANPRVQAGCEHLVPPSDRDTLSGIVSRLLVAYAASQGVDLLETLHSEARPQA